MIKVCGQCLKQYCPVSVQIDHIADNSHLGFCFMGAFVYGWLPAPWLVCTVGVVTLQDKPVKTETVKEEDRPEGAKPPTPKTETATPHTSTTTNTGTDTPHFSLPAPQREARGSAARVYKMEDMYPCEIKPTFVQRPSPLEVPVLGQRMATSVMSPVMAKAGAVPNQAESPQHRAALPSPAASSASSVLKAPSFLPHHPPPLTPSPAPVRNHERSRKQGHPQPASGQRGGLLSQGASHHHHHQKAERAPTAHSHTTPSLSQHLKLAREHLLNRSFPLEHAAPLSRDPHVLASLPNFLTLPDPPPAHSNYPKEPMPPDNQPRPRHAAQPRHHKEMRTNPEIRFPHPDQVLRRIHSEQHAQRAAQLPRQPKVTPPSIPTSASAALSKSAADLGGQLAQLASLPRASALGGRDSGSHSREKSSQHQSRASTPSGSKNHVAGPSSGSRSSSGAGSGSGQGSGVSQKDTHAERVAEAVQQQQQSEVLLQSALFGAQFTALPRVRKVVMIINNKNNNNNECISRAPFHVKHAQLRWTGANTRMQSTCI